MAIKEISLSWMRNLNADKELRTMGQEDALVVKDYRREASPEPAAIILSGKRLKELQDKGIIK